MLFLIPNMYMFVRTQCSDASLAEAIALEATARAGAGARLDASLTAALQKMGHAAGAP